MLSDIIGNTSDIEYFGVNQSKEDKIELLISGYRVVGGYFAEETGRAFLDRIRGHDDISAIPEERRPNLRREDESIFFRTIQGRGRSTSIKFRTPDRRYYVPAGSPLIGGIVRLYRQRTEDENFNPAVWAIDTTLSINPSRFLHHNRDRSWILAANRGLPIELSPHNLLSRSRSRTNRQGERTFDRNDNCILEHLTLRQVSGRFYGEIRNALVNYAHQFLLQRFEAAADGCGAVIRGAPTYNIRKLETYWEKASCNPKAYVWSAFIPLIRRGRFNAIGYPPPTSLSNTENALMVTVKIRKGVDLKLYAKTNQRVRYEIATDLAKVDVGVFSPHTFETLDEVVRVIELHRNWSAEQLSTNSHYLRQSTNAASQFSTLFEFLDIIAECCPDHTEREALISSLAINNSLTHRNGEPLRAVVDRLRRRGVVENTGHSVVSVTQRFRSVIELLSNHYLVGD